MANEVTGMVMRVILEGVKQLSGTQFPTLLREAGLERYTTALPDDAATDAGTYEELGKLYAAIHSILGEDIFRRFQRNSGISAAESMIKIGLYIPFKEDIVGFPPEKRLSRLVEQTIEISNQTWIKSTLTEDPRAWYVETSFCLACSGIQTAKAPICADWVSYNETMTRWILGYSVKIEEVECKAAGAKACKYSIAK